MRIVDLSVALKAGIASDPPSMLPRIKYLDHRDGAKEFMAWFPGLKAEQLPDGEGAAMEQITFTTHNMKPPRAVALRQHPGRRQASHEDRRGAAGVVFLIRRKAPTSAKSPTAMCARPTTSSASSTASAMR